MHNGCNTVPVLVNTGAVAHYRQPVLAPVLSYIWVGMITFYQYCSSVRYCRTVLTCWPYPGIPPATLAQLRSTLAVSISITYYNNSNILMLYTIVLSIIVTSTMWSIMGSQLYRLCAGAVFCPLGVHVGVSNKF